MTQDPASQTELVAIVEQPGTGALPPDCRALPFALADGSRAIAVEASPPMQALSSADRDPAANRPTLPASSDRRAVARAALVRQSRLERLAEIGTVLPAAGGIAVPSDLPLFAAANAPVLHDAFATLRARSQYQIVVTWDVSKAPERFAAAPELAPSGPGGQAVAWAEAAAALARRLGDGIAARLAAAVFDTIRFPGAPDCLLNLVVLADQREVDALETALEKVDAIWTEGLRIRLIGPSPAVSFALARIESVPPERSLAAARLLGLDPGALPDPAEIARCRRLAIAEAVRTGAALPAEIASAADLLLACGRVARAPAVGGPLPILSLVRDGPPMAALPPGAEDTLSEVA